MRTAEMEIKKGENLIVHRDEIMSRPARTWFQTEREKKLAQDASKGAYVSGFDQPSEKGKEKAPTEKVCSPSYALHETSSPLMTASPLLSCALTAQARQVRGSFAQAEALADGQGRGRAV